MASIVTSLLGGGNSGAIFRPTAVPIATPVTQDMTGTQYLQSQQGLQNQQALLSALQGQGGIQNQQAVYQQLQNIAQGKGPSPAQLALQQATGQNIANQAALMAGQRGAGTNVGLMARQIGQQGAGIQQQAANEAAQLQAQQQLGALGQMGGLATQQAGQQIGATGAYTQAAQQQQRDLLNQLQNQQALNVQQNLGLQGMQAQQAQAQQQAQYGLLGGALQAAGTGAALYATRKAEGGEVKKYANGGQASVIPNFNNESLKPLQDATGPQSSLGKFLSGTYRPTQSPMLARGGKVPALVSPGEKYLSPKDVDMVKHGAHPMQVGETIPGIPKVKGAKNSYQNDTIPKTLEEGGIVLPRSVTQSKNPGEAAMKFVNAVLSKKGNK